MRVSVVLIPFHNTVYPLNVEELNYISAPIFFLNLPFAVPANEAMMRQETLLLKPACKIFLS